MIEESGIVTELNESGASVSKTDMEELLLKLDYYLNEDALLILSGSIPSGVSKDIYKNSLINRKLFSALNVNDDYVPSRETAIMYCIALKLSYDESNNLLKTAGYSFYEYSNFDRIIKYFLDNKIYNITPADQISHFSSYEPCNTSGLT